MSAVDKIRAREAQRATGEVVPFPGTVPSTAEAVPDRPQITIPGDIADEVEQAAIEAGREDQAALLAELNAKHFVVVDGGSTFIAKEGYDFELDRPSLTLMRPEAFQELYANRHVTVTDGTGASRNIALGTWYRRHPGRRTYHGMALLPGREAPPGIFNLWRGWPYQPAAGVTLEDVKWFVAFLLNVICAGNKGHCQYLLGWLASAVQFPDRQSEVAIVLLGGRGVGKGTLGWMCLRLFGAHGMHIQHQRHLTGNFNGHLRTALLVFVDELFVGNKESGNVLKSLITENELAVERKGVDVVAVKNRLKIIMATNEGHAINAGADERRYCVLSVSDRRQGDHAYFGDLRQRWNNGGAEQVLGFLLNYDLKGFNIRQPPNTAAMESQKLQSLDPIGAWLLERLQEGRIANTDNGWVREQPRGATRDRFAIYVGEKHNRRFVNTSADALGIGLKQYFRTLGEKRQSSGRRERLWVFPELADARREFSARLRLTLTDWDETGDDASGGAQ